MPLRIVRTPAIYDHHNMFLSGIKKNVARLYNTMRARAMHTLLRFVKKKKFFSDSFLDFVLCGVLCAMATVSVGGAGRSYYAVVHAGYNNTIYSMDKCRPLHAVPLHYLAAAVPTDDLAVASQCPLRAP